MFWVDLPSKWYEDAAVFLVYFFIFCLEPALGKEQLLPLLW